MKSERGQILIVNVASLVMLLGVAALSIDASFMYDKRNKLYAAADAAAKSAAAEVHRNPGVSTTDLRTFANHEVSALGLDPGVSTTVTINHPPANGPFTCAASRKPASRPSRASRPPRATATSRGPAAKN